MKRINKSQFALLSLLSRRESLSGYDMKQIMNKISPFYWTENNAQIYPMLKQLEADGKVKSKLDESSGARKRRIYTITATGLRHLKEWLAQPIHPSPYREELLLKLATGEHTPNPILVEQIEDYQNELNNLQKQLVAIQEHIHENHAGRGDQFYLTLTYQHAELTLKAKLQWCDLALQQLQDYNASK